MPSPIPLAQGAIRRLQLRRGASLVCRHGCLWLSQNGEDIVLQAGQRHRAANGDQLLVEALADSSYHLQPATGIVRSLLLRCWRRLQPQTAYIPKETSQ